MRQAPVPGRIHAQEASLQDLQRVPVRDQEDVAAAVPPLQVRDESGRPAQHCGRGLNVTVRVLRIGLVGRPYVRVVGDRRPFPVPEAPLAEGVGDDNLRRAQMRAHGFCGLPRAGEARSVDEGVRGQAAVLRGRERLLAAGPGEPVVAAAVILDAADDDPGHVRLALRVPHDAERVGQAIDAAQLVHGRG